MTKAILFAFALSPATTLKSMLQQLDSQISTKDNFLHDQRSKLSEKEKVIINQRSELERLEKRSKTLEYKVLFHFTISFLHFVCFLCTNLPPPPFQIDILQKTTEMYEQDKRTLQQELETREQRLHRELSERRRMEHRMQGMVTDAKLKWEKECVSEVNGLSICTV